MEGSGIGSEENGQSFQGVQVCIYGHTDKSSSIPNVWSV